MICANVFFEKLSAQILSISSYESDDRRFDQQQQGVNTFGATKSFFFAVKQKAFRSVKLKLPNS